jgi:hypothetical protein
MDRPKDSKDIVFFLQKYGKIMDFIVFCSPKGRITVVFKELDRQFGMVKQLDGEVILCELWFMRFIHLTIQVIGLCVFLLSAKAQQQSFDIMIPYNNKWEICDRSAATYYRTGKLVLDKYSFFSGEVKDFYKGGNLQMTGNYNATGLKHGAFTYYYPDGKVEREGAFENDEMKGIWSFYAADGTLIMKADCRSNFDFIPLYYKNKNGEELIKDGNGHFALDLRVYPNLIWESSPLRFGYMEGECIKGVREGQWKYYITETSIPLGGKYVARNLYYEDRYKAGKFVSGKRLVNNNAVERYDKVAVKMTLYPKKDKEIDRFATDFAFGNPIQKGTSLTEFLFKGIKPHRISSSLFFANNMRDYIECFHAAFNLHTSYKSYLANRKDFGEDSWTFFDQLIVLQPGDTLPADASANLDFWVRKDGRITNMEMKSVNLPDGMEKTLRYHFSVLTNLAPMPGVDSARVQLKFSMVNEIGLIDGVKVNVCCATLINGDGVAPDRSYAVRNSVVLSPVVASFPGGERAWQTYLQNTMRQYMKKAKVRLEEGSRAIYASFVVNEEGHVINVKCDYQSHYNAEMTDLLLKTLRQSPRWIPGSLDGKPVKCRFNVPFKYGITPAAAPVF